MNTTKINHTSDIDDFFSSLSISSTQTLQPTRPAHQQQQQHKPGNHIHPHPSLNSIPTSNVQQHIQASQPQFNPLYSHSQQYQKPTQAQQQVPVSMSSQPFDINSLAQVSQQRQPITYSNQPQQFQNKSTPDLFTEIFGSNQSTSNTSNNLLNVMPTTQIKINANLDNNVK